MKLNESKIRPYDYLKYWKVVRQFIKIKHKLTQADLDILFFLYTEKYFTKTKFDEFNVVLGWNPIRFGKLLKNGWIESISGKQGLKRKYYQLSNRGVRVVNTAYKLLNGEEMPMTVNRNPIFGKTTRYTDRVLRNFIAEMNKDLRNKKYDNIML